MKIVSIIILISASIFGYNSYAQMPNKAQDIHPLLYGESIPEATLAATDGNKVKLSSLLQRKSTVLLFYRGGWCPYCNAQLSDVQNIENEIIGLGYQIVAVSPDSPENLKQTADKDKLNYSLYSDGDGALMKAVGIAFKVPEDNKDFLFKSSGGKNEGLLPVPSVFVVDTSGKILFEYINPDYKTRLRSSLLIAVLKNLAENK